MELKENYFNRLKENKELAKRNIDFFTYSVTSIKKIMKNFLPIHFLTVLKKLETVLITGSGINMN